jgi:hypothetical protein
MACPVNVAAVSAFVAAEYASEGIECAGTDGNIVHLQLPSVTENVTEIVAELYARFGAEADVVLTPKGANLVVYVPSSPPPPPAPARSGFWRAAAAGVLLAAAGIGMAHQWITDQPNGTESLPPNTTWYIWW